MKRRNFFQLLLLTPLILKAKLFQKDSKMFYSIHRSEERGTAEHGWLHSKFSFSFSHYYNPDRMGFGALRVINDDIVEPGKGFSTHPHQNMEIISVVTKGAIEHKDSFGNHDVINEGEIQYMSAGNGVYHSEYNPSLEDPVEFFQVWIHPKVNGGEPIYDKRDFTQHDHKNQWVTLVSHDPNDKAMMIKQDAKIHTTQLDKDASLELAHSDTEIGRLIFVVNGSVSINGETLNKRDEMQIVDTQSYSVTALDDAQIMLFEVPLT